MRLIPGSVALLAVGTLVIGGMASPSLANGKGRGGGGHGGGRGHHWRPPNCNRNNPPPRRNVVRRSHSSSSFGLGIGLGFGGGYYGDGYGGGYYGGSAQWVPDAGRYMYYSSGPIIQSCGCQSARHYTTCDEYVAPEPIIREYHYRTVYQPYYVAAPAQNINVRVKVKVDNRTTAPRRTYVVEDDDDDEYIVEEEDDGEEEEVRTNCRHKKRCSGNQCNVQRGAPAPAPDTEQRGGYWTNRLRNAKAKAK